MTNQPTTVELSRYRPIEDYVPHIGDFVIWQGWTNTKFGVVSDIKGGTLRIILDGTPRLLLTMAESEMKNRIQDVQANDIITRKAKYYSIMSDRTGSAVWYI